MSNSNDTLKELIQIANDGAEFYVSAADGVDNPLLVDLFRRMGSHKRVLSESLSGTLEQRGGQAPTAGTMAGTLRKAYADLRASLGKHAESVYVAQLEETEDRLLHHFEQAIADTDDETLAAALRMHLPKVRTCHDEMRGWKMRMKNAA